jgi:hypothetical protein
MYPPVLAPPLLMERVEAAISDPPVRLFCLESLSPFYILFLAHKPKAVSRTRKVLLPRSPWADDHGALAPSLEAGRQSGSTTRRTKQIGPGHRYASRQEGPSHIRRHDSGAAFQHKEELTERQGNRSGSCELSRCLRRQMFAVSDISIALELRRAIRSENGRLP